MRVLLASPRGFCAGVERAIQIVELALARFGPPVYVRHEIVHNRSVVESLRARGVVFVDHPEDAPPGSLLIFSAHGVSPAVRQRADACGHRVVDATCPLVTKVHVEAQRYARGDKEILLVGHAGHVEVDGTLGEAPDHIRLVETVEDARTVEVSDPERVAVLTQTTLSVDDTRDVMQTLQARFERIAAPRRSDICYATQNRQDAVKALAGRTDLVIVVGSPTSSNGTRLVETARRAGARVLPIETAMEIDGDQIAGAACVGVTSGAAVPERLVQEVVERLRALADVTSVETMATVEETIRFQVPAVLRDGPEPASPGRAGVALGMEGT